MVTQITDDLKAQANVSAGSRIAGVQVQNAFQIQGWLEVNGIFFGNAGLSIMSPFLTMTSEDPRYHSLEYLWISRNNFGSRKSSIEK